MWYVYTGAWCSRFSQMVKPTRHLVHPYLYTSRKGHSATPICSSTQKIVLCQTEYQTLCTVYNGNTSNERYPSTIGRRHLLWSMQAMARSQVDGSPASQHWECALHTIKSNCQNIRLRRPTPLLDQCSIRWTMCQLTIIPDSCHPTQLERSRDPNIPL